MSGQSSLREEQISALQEAAEKLTSRTGHVFNFDQKKLDNFKGCNQEKPQLQAPSGRLR